MAVKIPTKIEATVGPETLTNALAALAPLVNTGERIASVPLTQGRVWNAPQTNLGTAGNDDLGLTTAFQLTTSASGTTEFEQFGLLQVPVPNNYHEGDPLTIRVNANVATTINTVINELDVSCTHTVNGGAASSDLVTTAAVTMTTTAADYDFVIPANTTIKRGGMLNVLVAMTVDDATAIKAGLINSVSLVY